jgi:hypothetical protein
MEAAVVRLRSRRISIISAAGWRLLRWQCFLHRRPCGQ